MHFGEVQFNLQHFFIFITGYKNISKCSTGKFAGLLKDAELKAV